MQDLSRTHDKQLSVQVSSRLQHYKYCNKSTVSTACGLPHPSSCVYRQETACCVQLTRMKLVGTFQPGTTSQLNMHPHVDCSALHLATFPFAPILATSHCSYVGIQVLLSYILEQSIRHGLTAGWRVCTEHPQLPSNQLTCCWIKGEYSY